MTTTTETTDTDIIPSEAGAFPVKLNERTPQRLTIKCGKCDTMTRVYRVEPSVQIGAFKFCPVCGSTNCNVYFDAATDHWESLARDYGLTIPLIKQIYELWEPQKCQHFGTFVKRFLASLVATADES